MSNKTLKIDSLMHSRLERSKTWLKEIIDQVGASFNPDNLFTDYIDKNKEQLFDEETAESLDEKLGETYELFSYFREDIYQFTQNHLNSHEHAITELY